MTLASVPLKSRQLCPRGVLHIHFKEAFSMVLISVSDANRDLKTSVRIRELPKIKPENSKSLAGEEKTFKRQIVLSQGA